MQPASELLNYANIADIAGENKNNADKNLSHTIFNITSSFKN